MDKLRTLLAKFIVRQLNRPLFLVIHAWLWLAAETDDPYEKRCCLEAVLELNPKSQYPRALSAVLFQREVRSAGRASIADRG